LFLPGFLFTAFQLTQLPSRLALAGLPNAQVSTLVAPLLIGTGITLIIALSSLYLILSSKKEVVVYLDRKTANEAQKTDDQQTTDVTTVLQNLRKEKGDTIEKSLSALCQWLPAGQGAYYTVNQDQVQLAHAFAFVPDDSRPTSFQLGEGLIGQAAVSGQSLYLDEIPEGYIRILSGLGYSSPRYLYIFCLKKGAAVVGVYELATFAPVSAQQKQDIEQIAALVAGRL